MEPLRLALSIEWDDCTVALAGAGLPVLELSARSLLAASAGPQASRDALSLLSLALARADRSLAEVGAFYFNCGPGAFTSLRIAAALVQGLALPRRRPVGAIGSLQALAATVPAWQLPGAMQQAAAEQPDTPIAEPWLLCTALDARMGECYYGASRCRAGHWPEPLLPPAVGTPAQARAAFESLCQNRDGQGPAASAALAGGGFMAFEPLREWALGQGHDPQQAASRRPSATAVLAVGCALGAPRPGPARDARPLYVRDRVALDRDEQRQAAMARAARTAPAVADR